MKKVVLVIKKANWGMHKLGDWVNTTWTIYDDCSVNVRDSYASRPRHEEYKECSKIISSENLEKLLENIELAKDINKEIDACDGIAWEFTQYNRGFKIWKRKLGYIYGIEPLEECAKLIEEIN